MTTSVSRAAPGLILQRGDAFPTTEVGSHQAEIIHHDLSRESSVAFVTISVFCEARVALGQGLYSKVGELDPSSDDRLAAPELEAESPDRKCVSRRRCRKINIVTALNFAQLRRSTGFSRQLHASDRLPLSNFRGSQIVQLRLLPPDWLPVSVTRVVP